MAPFISIDIERLINGDEKVFKSLFDYSYVGMVQRAVYYTNDLDTAEDIVQEVFMRLWEKREELRGIQNIQGYLLFSIRNKCLNLLEHQQVMDKYRQYCLLQEVSDEEMSVLESKSYAEIAASLSISLNTVKDHIKKAYAFLREEVCKDISSPVLFCAFCYREKCI